MPQSHYMVVDFEATCTDTNAFPRGEMEIIEVGAVMVAADGLQPVSEFQSFIRPVRHPRLTDFCTSLTSITQTDVDTAPEFGHVLAAWLEWKSSFAAAMFCSWGDYDRKQLLQDCEYHGATYPFGEGHINLKAEFARRRNVRPMGLDRALRSVSLNLDGTHHRGIDDARNIARLLRFVFTDDDNDL